MHYAVVRRRAKLTAEPANNIPHNPYWCRLYFQQQKNQLIDHLFYLCSHFVPAVYCDLHNNVVENTSMLTKISSRNVNWVLPSSWNAEFAQFTITAQNESSEASGECTQCTELLPSGSNGTRVGVKTFPQNNPHWNEIKWASEMKSYETVSRNLII